MESYENSNTIVILGNWNKNIFNMNWVAKNLFDLKQIQIEFPLMISEPPRFIGKEIMLTIDDNRIMFTALKNTNKILLTMIEIVNILPKFFEMTPVSAIGLNFGFVEDNLEKISYLFELPDNAVLSDNGAIINNYAIKRNIKLENLEFNLAINKLERKVHFDVNLHNNITNIKEINKLYNKDNIVNKKEIVMNFLNDVYKLDEEMIL